MITRIFDLHAHPSLKPYSNRGDSDQIDIWSDWKHELDTIPFIDSPFEGIGALINRPLSRLARRGLGSAVENMAALFSQSNLNSAIEGRVKCVVLSIYPTEREFFTRGRSRENGNQDKLISWFSGHSTGYIDDVQAGRFSYWDQFSEEIRLLKEGQNKPHPENGWQYRIITTYDEFQQLSQEDRTIGIILSAEGVQSLASNIEGQENDFYALKKAAESNSADFEKWRKDLLANINTLKTGELKQFTPLYITVSHHFFNYVGGHCDSLPELKIPIAGDVLFRQEGQYTEGGKTLSYFDWGFTGDYGKEVVRKLLKRDPASAERRILVDIKHMSPSMRTEFYEMLDTEYAEEKVPVICSHTACNGIDKLVDHRSGNPDFNHIPLNTYDEDIRKIYQTSGLMGLMLDDGRICSSAISDNIKTLDDRIEKLDRKIKRLSGKRDRARSRRRKERLKAKIERFSLSKKALVEVMEDIYLENFYRQVFHVVSVLQADGVSAGEKAWDILCLGSDYDGAINPMDAYGTYADLDRFAGDLIEHWNDKLDELDDEDPSNDTAEDQLYKACLFDRTPEYWVNKVFWANADDFLRRHFHDDYLINGNPG